LKEWTKTILEIKKKVEKELNYEFNSVYCNLYRDGNGIIYIISIIDYIGYHSDDVRANDKGSPIASLSFGCTRKFYLKSKEDPNRVEKLSLENGSLLVSKSFHSLIKLVGGDTQDHWKHSIPKELKIKEERINLTFRKISKNK
jgi:alkylated DNA repair dioxygenase AlkB